MQALLVVDLDAKLSRLFISTSTQPPPPKDVRMPAVKQPMFLLNKLLTGGEAWKSDPFTGQAGAPRSPVARPAPACSLRVGGSISKFQGGTDPIRTPKTCVPLRRVLLWMAPFSLLFLGSHMPVCR